MMKPRPEANGRLADSHTMRKEQSSDSDAGPPKPLQDPSHRLPGRTAGGKVPSKAQKGTHRHTHIMLASLCLFFPASIFNQPTPNGPYTLLKIYSYKLHCPSGLCPGDLEGPQGGWFSPCPLGSHHCTQTGHHPGTKMAGFGHQPAGQGRGLGLMGWDGEGAQRGTIPPCPAGTNGRRWIWCLQLSIYRYLQK